MNGYYHERNLRENGRAVSNEMPYFENVSGRIGKLTGYHMLENEIVGTRREISFSEEDMACGILFLGNAGCGKTNVINRLMYDVLSSLTKDDIAIIYDVKKEFTEHFCIGGDIVIAPDSYKAVWNLYNDVIAFAYNERNEISEKQIRMRSLEVASRLFEGQRSETNPFFVTAATQTVAGIIELNIMAALTMPGEEKWLNNRRLLDELSKMGQAQYYERFVNAGSRFEALSKYFTQDGDSEGKGIVTEISAMIGRQLVGAFGEAGDFSLADVVKNRGGKAVFIQNDISLGDTLAPVLTTIFDMAISYAARPQVSPKGRIFLFLDELATLRSTRLEMALTLLRSQRVCIIGGLQDVQRLQMNEPNNQSKTLALLNAFQNVIAMSCTADTREYLQKRFGKTQVWQEYDASNGKQEKQLRERNVVEDDEFAALQRGDAFCQLRGFPVFKYHFDKFVFENKG